MSCPIVAFEDLNLIDYKKAWDYQTSLFNPIIDDNNIRLPWFCFKKSLIIFLLIIIVEPN